RLCDWHDTMMATMPFKDKSDPLWTVLQENGPFHAMLYNLEQSNYLKHLKETGREDGIKALLDRHPEIEGLLD
ncbi:MAG: hypothetical protein HN368_04610, partial [Spirochaetales bacterium]|nr:hypothetical protein [Spirochaetales bacterium]